MFRERRPTLPIVCGLLVLAVIAVYGQTAGYDFVNFDDGPFVYENQHVLQGLTREGVAWAFTQSRVSSQWQPLTLLSLMADAELVKSGDGLPDRARLAAEMHVVNVALHALNAVILLLVLRAMTSLPSPFGRGAGGEGSASGRGTMLRTVPRGEGLWPSALVAALFAVHPLHVESVAWITERKDVLSGLFGLLSLAAYVWYVRGPGLFRYLLVAAALALGLMAKPMLVTWPLVLLLLDYWPLGRWQGAGSREQGEKGEREQGGKGEREQGGKGEREQGGKGEREKGGKGDAPLSPPLPFSLSFLIVEKIPLLMLSAASATVTFLAQRAGGSVISLKTMPLYARLARGAVLYVVYLGKALWPANLTAVYFGGPLESYWPVAGAGALLALLTAGAVWGAWRGQRWLAVGWFWYLGTLLPTIGLVQVGTQVIADRFLYLPQIGLCIALAWAVGSRERGAGSRERGAGSGERGAGSGERGAGSREQGAGSGERGAGSGERGAGSRERGAGSREQGAGEILSFSLSPSTRCAGAPPFSLSFLSALLLAALTVSAWQQTRYWRNSEALWARALTFNPQNPAAHNNLGLVLGDRGQVDQAIAHWRKALEAQPDYTESHYNLGLWLSRRGQIDEAIAHYRTLLEIKSDHVEAQNNLGVALAGRGKFDEAIVHYRKALEIKPEIADTHYNLGLALAARSSSTRPWPSTARSSNSSPTTPRPTTAWETSWPAADRSRRPSAISRRPWKSGPRWPRPTTTWARPWPPAGSLTRPWPSTTRPWRSSPIWPTPATTWRACWPAAESLTGRSPSIARPWPLRPTSWPPATTWRASWRAAASSTRPSPITARSSRSHRTSWPPTSTWAWPWPADGQFDEAIAHYQRVLELEPRYAEAHNNLGAALANRGRMDEAIAHWRQALEIKPDYAQAGINLADVLAARGLRDEALAHYQAALTLATAAHDKAMTDYIRARIKRYSTEKCP